jgi:hypothetical protein
VNLAAIALGAVETRIGGKAFVCHATANIDSRAIPISILVDSGAEVSFVNQKWAKQHLPDSEALPRTVKAINEQTVRSFGAHQITLEMTDSEGNVREDPMTCEAVDIQGYDIILGYDWLSSANPDINYKENTWRYRKDKPIPISKISAAVCYNEIATGAFATAIYPQPSDKNGPVSFFHAVIDDGETVPEVYRDFEDVFDAGQAGKLAQNSHLDHAIDLQNGTQPPHQPIYPLSPNELGVLRSYINEMLAKEWIRPSQSPAGAPIIFVKKKDGSLRLCVDYRGLNKITIKNRYPLPLVSETMNRLSGAKIFTQLDLRDAYHRIRIREGDEWKTAFRTRYGHFEYTVMPFGLANAPATFQAYINRALCDLLDQFCVVYLDDILIFSRNEEEHIEHVREVFRRLRTYQLYVKRSKCRFHTDSVTFLGFVITTEDIQMEEERVKAIDEWPIPECAFDVQQFIGYAGFYRHFIKGFSTICAPISATTHGRTAKSANKRKDGFQWTPEAQTAFDQLKGAFRDPPVLRHFDPELALLVECDASGFGLGGILSQLHQDGGWHPIAYWSRKMNGAETRYETHDSELLAIVECFKQWRHYLEGSKYPVRVLTDHANLRYFMTTKTLNGRQARWSEYLAAFDFVIEYRAGKKNPADGPSRRPDYVPKDGEAADMSMLPTLQEKIRQSYGPVDPNEIPLIKWIMADGMAEVPLPKLRRVTIRVGPSRTGPVHRGGRLSSQDLQKREQAQYGQEDQVDSSSRMPRLFARRATDGMTAYPDEMRPSLIELIKYAQAMDPVSVDKLGKLKGRAHENEPVRLEGTGWTKTSDGLLRHSHRVYVPNDPALRQEIMKIHHDDPQGGHYREKRTQEAIGRRFY